MDLDEDEDDPEIDVDDEEEEEPLPASPPLLYELNQLEHKFGIHGSRVQSLTRGMGTHRIEIAEAHKEIIRARRRLDRIKPPKRMSNVAIERMIADIVDATIAAERTAAAAKAAEVARAAAAAETTRASVTAGGAGEIRLEVTKVDWYRIECELYSVQAQMHDMQQELYWRGFEENCPTESIDVLATYGDADPPEIQEPSDMQ
nr:hypothetical protein [Tanacetum cinerariifolium]